MSENIIKFYSMDNCVGCQTILKELLSKLKSPEIIKLNEREKRKEIFERYGVKYVPFVTINNRSIIHTEDLQVLLEALKPSEDFTDK